MNPNPLTVLAAALLAVSIDAALAAQAAPTWTNVSPTSGPLPRYRHAMAYDSQRGVTVMFGGTSSGSNYLADTWEWNGSSWTQVSTTGPSARREHAMAYDSLRGRIVLFGGCCYLGDTWEWDSQNLAYALTFGAGCGSPVLDLAPVANARPVIGTTGQAALTNIPSPPAIAFVALGWSRTTSGGFSLPLSLAGFGMPGCDLLQSAEAAANPTTATGPGTATFSLPLPGIAGLLGLHLYLQGWATAPGTNSGNLIVSNGIHWRIGGV